MPDVILWMVIAAASLWLIHHVVVQGILLPHVHAERLKIRESLGRDPVRSELTRLQAFCITLAALSDAHPTLLGMDHRSTHGGMDTSNVYRGDGDGGGSSGFQGGMGGGDV